MSNVSRLGRTVMIDDYLAPPPQAVGRSFYATLAPFPIACFIGTFVTDLAYWGSKSVLWETFSVWLLTIGLVVAGLTVVAGAIDLARSRRIYGLRQPWLVVAGHVVAFALSLVNVFVHSRDGYTAVVPEGLILSGLVVLVLLITGWLGRPTIFRQRLEVVR